MGFNLSLFLDELKELVGAKVSYEELQQYIKEASAYAAECGML